MKFILIFFGYICLLLLSITFVFRKTQKKNKADKILLRSAVLTTFLAPCVFIGQGIFPAPAIVVLLYAFALPMWKMTHVAIAFMSLVITFLLFCGIGHVLIKYDQEQP